MRHAERHPARANRRTPARFSAAFTVVELLVVVVIILIILTIATPAFQALIYSSQRSRAVNALNAGTLAARELALRSASGDDAAVVFVYDRDGVTRVIPAVRVGSVVEPPSGAEMGQRQAQTVRRDVFAPVAQAPSFEMPAYWSVRGHAVAQSMIDFVPGARPENLTLWYNSPLYGGRGNPTAPAKLESNWVFPETAFYDVEQQAAMGNGPTTRQSFMIRFDSRTGGISTNRDLALFVDPRPSTVNRPGGDRPDGTNRWLRADMAEDLAAWARGLLASPPINWDGRPKPPPYQPDADTERLGFIGSASNDTVLVKPVTRLALYDERRLARDVGARRLNPATGSLYRGVRGGDGLREIEIDDALFPSGLPGDLRTRINAWVDGDTNGDGEFTDDDQPEARLYLVQPGTGELTEVIR